MTVRMRVDRSYSPKDGMKVGFTYILTNFSIALLCRFNFCYVRRTSRRCCFDGITAADPPKLFDDMIGCHIRRKILLWLVGWAKSSTMFSKNFKGYIFDGKKWFREQILKEPLVKRLIFEIITIYSFIRQESGLRKTFQTM